MLCGFLLAILFLLLFVKIFSEVFAQLSKEDRRDLLFALLQVATASLHGVTGRGDVLKVRVDVGHRITVVGVEHGLLELLLNQSEKDIWDGKVATYKVALPLEMIIRNFKCFFQETIDVLVFNRVTLHVPKSLVADRASEWLQL